MSAYLNAVAIASSIAALPIVGVQIRDLDAIPEMVSARDCPVMYPKPDGFINNLGVDRISYGSALESRKNATYTLTYRYLHNPEGVDRAGSYRLFDAMMNNVDEIVSRIIDNDDLSGTVDITPAEISNLGLVLDPAGYAFHGCDIAFNVLVFSR